MLKRNAQALVLCLIAVKILSQDVPVLNWAELGKTKPWEATEQWQPVPAKITPGFSNQPPSDAIVLFNGKNLDQWHKPKYGYGARMDQVEAIIKVKQEKPEFSPPAWTIQDGFLVVKGGAGDIETKQAFGNIQLHIEWSSPAAPGKTGQAYSNSGIFLMGLYEIQVLNSYENETYPNGQAGAMYKQAMPLVNASLPPGEWQTYDIIFTAPQFNADGSLKSPAYITAFHNGVLIQNHFALKGPCVFIGKPKYIQHASKLPLLLQDHGDAVRFRSIWVRELN